MVADNGRSLEEKMVALFLSCKLSTSPHCMVALCSAEVAAIVRFGRGQTRAGGT